MATKTTKCTKRKGDHVLSYADEHGAGGLCTHCRKRLIVKLPCDLGVWLAAVNAFERRHRNCPEPK